MLAPSYHVVADIKLGQRPDWPLALQRAEAIRRAGVLQPSAAWAPPPRVDEYPVESATEELAFYLFGLANYVFFSFGRPFWLVRDVPAMTVTVDTEYLIRHRGARVVRDECFFWEDLGRVVCRELGIYVDDDPLLPAACHWWHNPDEWTRRAWPVAIEEVRRATMAGDEAVAFLGGLCEEDFGNYDILLQGSLYLTDALRVE